MFIPGVLVDIRTEKFILPLDKESALSVREYIIAVYPSTRLGSCLFVVRISRGLPITVGEEIRETKLRTGRAGKRHHWKTGSRS